MAKIGLIDTSVRDGNQSLWGATGLRTCQFLQIAPVMERVGFHAAEMTSSTHMGVAVRSFQEDPWERIRLMKRAMPNTGLQFLGTGMRFISWEVASDEFMLLVYQRLVANGITRFAIADPLVDTKAMLESAYLIRKAGGTEIVPALTYTISAIHDDAFYANAAAELAKSADVDRIYLKDPSGLLTPERARTLIPAIKARIGTKPLELHSHCTIGLAPLSYLAAADCGADGLQVAAGPLSNGTGQPSAERIVANLRESGHSVDIDDKALARMVGYFTRLARAEGLPFGAAQEYDAAFLRHQVPGGMITTMKRQLAELKLDHRYDEVIDEIDRVRGELGYPIMVTPFPQMVCAQALYNVISHERYATVPDEVIRYVMGRFGRPTTPIDANLQDRILDRPRARELADEPPPRPLSEIRKRFDANMSDEEFLLRATMPADQVDSMRKSGPRGYSPEMRPLIHLLKGIGTRSDLSDIVVDKPGFKLHLRANQARTAS
jgi:oxaloacetate decarboxylase alpha subunit